MGDYHQSRGMDSSRNSDGLSEHARVLDHYDDRGTDYQVIVGGGLPTIGSVEIEHLDDGGTFTVHWVSGDETVPAKSGAHDTPADRLHYVCGISHVPLTTSQPVTSMLDAFILRDIKMPEGPGECDWSAREVSVFNYKALARAAQGGGAPRVIAGGRAYTLDAAEAAGLVQVVALGSTTKVVAQEGSGVRLELPPGGTATTRTLSERGAGREQHYVLSGATSVALGGSGAVTRGGKVVKPAPKDTKAPRTKAHRRGGKVLLRRSEAGTTYVVVGGKRRLYTRPFKRSRKRTTYFSVDVWGNVEKPRKLS
jgi:hypothetical protein